MNATYIPCDYTDVPASIRFDVPRQNQGQIVEVAYGQDHHDRTPADHGAPWQRVTDRSMPSGEQETYFRLATE